jgi:dTDP-4-amino-4,6-dideoxygalactose transaminase
MNIIRYPLIDLKKEYLVIKDKIDGVITDVVKNARFILDKEIQEFEKKFAIFTNSKYCVTVASGSAALYLSLVALGIKKGDEIITVANTFAATVEAIINCGATPVFVDINKNTFNIDISKIEPLINKKTKAILIVHIYGQPADIDEILRLCRKYHILLIEDCAQAHGSYYKNKHVGTFGIVGCFSFFPSKNLGCYGDGGAIITNNKRLFIKLTKLRNHGRVSKYIHEEIGYGERMDNLQAAILNIKLDFLETWNKKRIMLAQIYNKYLNKAHIKIPVVKRDRVSNYYTYTIQVSYKKRDILKTKLEKEGIAAGLYYPIPLHLQKAFKFLGYKKGDLPITEEVAKTILSLPMHPFLRKKDIVYISNKLNKIVERI